VKRRFRLTEKARFRLVRQTGVSYTHPLLAVYLLANGQPFSRCGFTVSRRLGKAVERNRVRRRISEAVRLIWDLVEPGWDIVWIARSAIKSAEFAEIQEACIRLLKRGHVLRAAEAVVAEQRSGD